MRAPANGNRKKSVIYKSHIFFSQNKNLRLSHGITALQANKTDNWISGIWEIVDPNTSPQLSIIEYIIRDFLNKCTFVSLVDEVFRCLLSRRLYLKHS